MRKVVLVLGICLLAAPVWAGGGFALFGSYAQISEDAEAPGAGARFSLGSERWVGDLTWTWYQSQEDVNTILDIEDRIQVIPTDLGIRYLFKTSGSLKPYFGAGATFFWLNLNHGNADNALGGYAILGLNFGHGKTRFFAEAIYRIGSTDASYRINPDDNLTGSMDVGGIGINLGIAWGY